MSDVNKKRKRVVLIAVLAGVLAGIWVLVVFQGNRTEESTSLRSDKVYATYRYGEPNTIYVGTQPLYAPTGLITEAMRRDSVLKEELQKLGVKIVFYPFMKGADVNTHLIDGRLQAGVGGDMPTLTAAAKTNLVIPVRMQSGPTWLVTRTPVFLKDLEGKRIAYAKGSNAHFMLLNLLSSEGLSESDVVLVPMDVDLMIEALQNQSVSAIAAWEPTPTIAGKKYGFVTRFGGPSSGYLYFRKDFAEKHPAALRQIVAGVARANLWLHEDGGVKNRVTASGWSISAAEELMGAKLPLLPQELANIATQDILMSKWLNSFVIPAESLSKNGRLGREYAFLKEIGTLPEETRWEDIQNSFDTTMLLDILGHPLEYRLSEFRYTPSPITPERDEQKQRPDATAQQKGHNEPK